MVTPPAPLITADTVNPSAALVVVIVRVAANARFPLIDAFAAPPVDAMLPVRVSVPAPVVTVPPVTPLFTVKAPMLSENPFRSYVPPSLTVTAPVDNALAAPYCNAPALIVVRPVYKFAPDSFSVPVPAFVNAPVVFVLAPVIVSVLAAVATFTVEVVPAVNVKLRSVDAVAPVYSSVPPPSTRFVAALPDAPMLLATPPPAPSIATVFALNTPALIVVTPV